MLGLASAHPTVNGNGMKDAAVVLEHDPDTQDLIVKDKDGNPGKLVNVSATSPMYQWSKRLNDKLKVYNQRPDETLKELQQEAMHRLPYAVFALMPMFAFLLWLVYFRHRLKYGVHLVFTLHLHAFTFLLFLLALLAAKPAELVILGVPLYLVLALIRMYGGSWFGQLWRALLLALAYLVCVSLILLLLLVSLI